jgi:hypothetical protein
VAVRRKVVYCIVSRDFRQLMYIRSLIVDRVQTSSHVVQIKWVYVLYGIGKKANAAGRVKVL